MNIKNIKLVPAFALSASFALLVGCGGATDSGQEGETVQQQDVEDNDNTLVYSGPIGETDDVRQFKLEVWDKLAGDDRCGACHNEEVGQEPLFLRRDDINLAYDTALPLIDKTNPVASRLYLRAAGGHNPWDGSAPGFISTIISNWATVTGASATAIILIPPDRLRPVDSTRQFPVESTLYESTIYPLVRDTATANCVFCHSEESELRQQPFFASSNVATAYSAARTLIDLENAVSSRFVGRMQEGHNAWPDPDGEMTNALYSAQEMTAAINLFLLNDLNGDGDGDDPGEGLVSEPLPEGWLVSSASNIAEDGQIASVGGRVQRDVIALYQFKQGEGQVAYDLSGVDPQLHLNLSPTGVDWVGSWGLRFSDNGKAQGTTDNSKKLHDLIRTTGEYSVEAWVVPANVTQEEARIVTYSGSNTERNFALMQNLYDYRFLTRSENSDGNGMPLLNTPSDDEVLQATLQHVVTTYDPIEGRSIYVNGVSIVSETEEDDNAGDINDWDDGFVLAIGNEVDSADDWQGTIRLLAIHNRVLTEEQVKTNYDVGVGQKYFLFFNVSGLVGIEDSFVVFEVEQYDDTAYLFQNPIFKIIDGSDTVPTASFSIEGMRIGINGKEAAIGQAFANINIEVSGDTYDIESGISLVNPNLTPSGTIIGLENGLINDLFFLTFDRIGGIDAEREDVPNPVSDDEPEAAGEQPDIGLRLFDEIFQTMSAVTTVPSTSIYEFYVTEIRRSLPSATIATGFLASHQSAVTQLALAYCSALVGTESLRAAFFIPDYATVSLEDDGIATPSDLEDRVNDRIITPLLNHMLILNGLGVENSITTNPQAEGVRRSLDYDAEGNAEEFDGLLQVLSSKSRDEKAMAACTSVLASAAMLMQ